jgi:hypothetical protein
VLNTYLKTHGIAAACQTIITDLNRVFHLEACRTIRDIDQTHVLDEACIIKRGISPTLDELLKNSRDGNSKLIAIAGYFSSLIQQSEKLKKGVFVKIHETAKGQATLVCTSRRAALLKTALKQKNIAASTLTYDSKYSESSETFEFDLTAL